MTLRTAVAVMLLALSVSVSAGTTRPSTQPTGAIAAYVEAAALIRVDSPANGIGDDTHPPYSDAWKTAARAAWQRNGPVREAVRRARGLPSGTWPDDGWYVGINYGPNVRWLNEFRTLTNDLADAAEFALLEGRPSEALDLLDDIARLDRVLRVNADRPGADVRQYVATGVEAVRYHRLLIVAPQLDLSLAATDAVSPQRLRQIMASFDGVRWTDAYPDPMKLLNPDAARAEAALDYDRKVARGRDPYLRMLDHVAAERAMVTVSLACQLFRHDNDRWPADANELVPKYLAALPIDPFATPERPVGYLLDKGGLPGGGDRPLAYSLQAVDGIDYARTVPLTGFYRGNGDPTAPPERQKQKLGQFRDVAGWPTTRPACVACRLSFSELPSGATVLYPTPW